MASNLRAASRNRRRQQQDPLRIRIDKRPTDYTDAYSSVWYVSPVQDDIRGDDHFPYATYELEVLLGGQYEDGMVIKRLAYKDGDRYEVLTVKEFDERVEGIVEHEGRNKNVATDRLTSKNIWPETSMRVFGFNLSYFDRAEAAWRAALQFMDFGYTGP